MAQDKGLSVGRVPSAVGLHRLWFYTARYFFRYIRSPSAQSVDIVVSKFILIFSFKNLFLGLLVLIIFAFEIEPKSNFRVKKRESVHFQPVGGKRDRKVVCWKFGSKYRCVLLCALCVMCAVCVPCIRFDNRQSLHRVWALLGATQQDRTGSIASIHLMLALPRNIILDDMLRWVRSLASCCWLQLRLTATR
jgi:hypothetical protein